MQSFRLFKRLYPYVDMRWKLTLLAFSCTFAGLLLGMLQPLLFSYLIDHVLIEKKAEWVAPLLGLSLTLTVFSVAFTIVRSGLFRYLGICNTLDIRRALLRHIRKIPVHEIEKSGTGKFSALLGFDTATMGNFLNHVIVELSSQLFMMAAALVFLFVMDWRIALLAVAVIPLLLYIPRLFRKPMADSAAHVRSHNEQVGTVLIESIEGSKEIRAFGLEAWEERRNDNLYAGLIRASTRETLLRVVTGQTGMLPISLIVVVLYWFGSRQALNETISVGMLVASVTYLNNALNPVRTMNDYFGELQRTEVAMSRIEEFMRTEIEPAISAELPPIGGPDAGRAGADAAIDCRSLRVSSEGADIVRGIDFTVKRGQVAAFIGRSGSGKTTLFKSMIGFMPIESGELVIEGVPIRHMTRRDLVSTFGVVFQESFLFRGTLYENIALGDLNASREEVYEAARLARLQAFIDGLPDGLDTRVDHKGFQLSGGQRQRIAIARAFLKKPPILLLDEPTSALDRETEGEVLAALGELMRGKTTLLSTHRLETVQNADIIYVMENGRIVEAGTHLELMARRGTYYAIMSAGGEGHAAPVSMAGGRL